MRVAVTGGTGLVGRFVVRRLVAAGHEVTLLGRRAPEGGPAFRRFDLAEPDAAAVAGAEALVHAALEHVPGRYRGGEGQDAAGFLSRNLGGTVRLFKAAREAGVSRVVFLSSRAVYGGWPAGTRLIEAMEPRPDTLYGHVKREGEAALARMAGPAFAGASLRATGVYGPAGRGRAHKWSELFAAFAAGEAIAPRVATEVHGDDLAAAVALLLDGEARSGVWNVSDIVLDRADLLAEWARASGTRGPLPERADPAAVSVMATERLETLGWRPRGMAGLAPALAEMAAEKW